MTVAQAVRWGEVDRRCPLVGEHRKCLTCGQPAAAAFTLTLDLKGDGVQTNICKAWACPIHQVQVQNAQVQWAKDKKIINSV